MRSRRIRVMRNFLVAIPIAVLTVGGSTACATKNFVRTSVGEVNSKVDSMGKSLEETQERTRRNEGRIAEVDTKAGAVDKASKRLVYEVVLSEDEGNFKFAKTALPDEAKAKLDQMVAMIKADPKGV